MELLGIISYIILVIIALGWILGVRIKLGIINSTIFGSFIFTISAIILPLIEASLLHSLWLIILGFITPIILSSVMPRSKLLTSLINLIVNLYAGLIRIGIDKDRIKKEQVESNLEAVDNYEKE